MSNPSRPTAPPGDRALSQLIGHAHAELGYAAALRPELQRLLQRVAENKKGQDDVST
jgi:hypothetical protein